MHESKCICQYLFYEVDSLQHQLLNPIRQLRTVRRIQVSALHVNSVFLNSVMSSNAPSQRVVVFFSVKGSGGSSRVWKAKKNQV